AEAWLASHGAGLGGGAGDGEAGLELTSSHEIRSGRSTVLAYRQRLAGLPVEGSQARILVHHGSDGIFRVVYAAARLCEPPRGGFPPQRVGGAEALARVRGMEEHRDLTRWSEPRRVVLPPGGEAGEAMRAWRFSGTAPDLGRYRSFTFFVDTASGALVRVRDEVSQVDIDGHVAGRATPGMSPDGGGNAPVAADLPWLLATVPAGPSAYTDSLGAFTITGLGPGGVSVQAELGGAWAAVNDAGGSDLFLEQTVAPPGAVEFLFNEAPGEASTAQVNAYLHATLSHDFLKSRAPADTALDFALPCNVNIADTCNAFFSGTDLSINFFSAGGGCPNTAYSSVVAHEYGHLVVNRRGLSQGAFGEGFGDSLSILQYDDPLIGRDFYGAGTSVRDIAGANLQYPCSGEIHTCGQLLAGCWWDLKEALVAVLGIPAGIEEARQLFVDWSGITLGGQGTNSAHPLTAIEALTVDDDDGVLENGTPHYQEICSAFAAHGIACPALLSIALSLPGGAPDLLEPGVGTILPVRIEEIAGSYQPGSGVLHFSVDGGPFEQVSLIPAGADLHEAVLPAQACGSVISFYVSAADTDGIPVGLPEGAPAELHAAGVGEQIQGIAAHGFEADDGWSAGVPGDNATAGLWERGDPIGTAAQPENDHTPGPGVSCWFSGQGIPGGPVGAHDIDGGRTTLLSPLFDLSSGSGWRVSYWRWYSNDLSALPADDELAVDISNDGGATWTRVETIGPGHPDASGGWRYHELWVGAFVAPTSQVRIRFVAADEGLGNRVEAAVDDLAIDRLGCGASTDFRRGDCNGDGSLNVSDPIVLLDGLFGLSGPSPCEDACDADDSGALNVGDVILLLGRIFSGNPLPAPADLCGTDPTGDTLGCSSPGACP
ncbi:MAG: hypothetical protein ACE5GW_07675, partial [Planctomycetota bacterium]